LLVYSASYAANYYQLKVNVPGVTKPTEIESISSYEVIAEMKEGFGQELSIDILPHLASRLNKFRRGRGFRLV